MLEGVTGKLGQVWQGTVEVSKAAYTTVCEKTGAFWDGQKVKEMKGVLQARYERIRTACSNAFQYLSGLVSKEPFVNFKNKAVSFATETLPAQYHKVAALFSKKSETKKD